MSKKPPEIRNERTGASCHGRADAVRLPPSIAHISGSPFLTRIFHTVAGWEALLSARSAGLQPAVSPICNRQGVGGFGAFQVAGAPQAASLRYGRLKICATLCEVSGLALLLGIIVLTLAGCASPKPPVADSARVQPTANPIDEINVMAMPVAIDLDTVPGVDGFALRVYAVDQKQPKTQPIPDGTLDILMYDGLLKEVVADTSRYRRVWSFTAEQLRAFAFNSIIGAGYRFTLKWGADQPRTDMITVAVCYRPAQGKAIFSAPSSITVPAK